MLFLSCCLFSDEWSCNDFMKLLVRINVSAQTLLIISINTREKIICMQFEANVHSKISSICTNSENIREIDQNVPQFYDF